MQTFDALTDDTGQRWEFMYEETMAVVKGLDGEPLLSEGGNPQFATHVEGLTYRRGHEGEWLPFPPWADIREEWKVNLGFFDEDAETNAVTYWEVT